MCQRWSGGKEAVVSVYDGSGVVLKILIISRPGELVRMKVALVRSVVLYS